MYRPITIEATDRYMQIRDYMKCYESWFIGIWKKSRNADTIIFYNKTTASVWWTIDSGIKKNNRRIIYDG